MTLRWRRWVDPLGARGMIEVYWESLDEQVYGPDPKPTIADCGHTVVGRLLAEPLRRAFHQHLDEHGCATEGHPNFERFHGFGQCDTAMELFNLLPAGDTAPIA